MRGSDGGAVLNVQHEVAAHTCARAHTHTLTQTHWTDRMKIQQLLPTTPSTLS